MRRPAVEDVDLRDAAGDGLHGRPGLGHHPAGDHPFHHELFQLSGAELAQETGRVMLVRPDPVNIGEKDELFGCKRFGDGTRGQIAPML